MALKSHFRFGLSAVLLSLILVLTEIGAEAIERAPGWSIKMRSNFYGDLDLSMSPIGMRFESTKTGITVTTLPPDGKVIAYNAETRKKFETSADTFNRDAIKSGIGNVGQLWREVGTGTLAGLKVVKLRNFEEKELPGIMRLRQQAARQNRDPEFTTSPEEMWIATDIKLPAKFMTLLQKMTQLKPTQLNGIKSAIKGKSPVPVRVYRYMGVGRKVMVLDTISATRTNFTSKDFAIPPGLKKVKSEMALLFDEEDDTSFGMFGGETRARP